VTDRVLARGRLDLFTRLMVGVVLVVSPFALVRGLYNTPDTSQFEFIQWSMGITALITCALSLRRPIQRPSPGTLLVLGFGLWCILSTLWSTNVLHSLHELCAFAAGITVYLLVVSNRCAPRTVVLAIIWWAVLTSAFNAMMADLQFIAGRGPLADTGLSALVAKALGYADATKIGKLNIRALFGHPNYLSGHLVSSFVLAIWLLRRRTGHRPAALLFMGLGIMTALMLWQSRVEWRVQGIVWTSVATLLLGALICKVRWIQRLVLLATVVGILAAIIVCRSRSGWGSLMVLTLLGVIVAFRHRRLRSWHVALLLLVGGSVIAGFISLRQRQQQSRSIEEVATFSSITSRIYSYSTAVRLIARRPIQGWGYGRFKIEYWPMVVEFQSTHEDAPLYDAYLREASGRTPLHIHNDYLEIAVETGLIGLALFLALMTWTLVRLAEVVFATPSHESTWLHFAVSAALLGLLCDMMLGYPLNLPLTMVLFWALLGAAHRLIDQTDSRLKMQASDESRPPADALEFTEAPAAAG
jgi:O-antigen ligase